MLQILKGGCKTKHPSSFIMSRPAGLNNYLLLIIRSHGQFKINTDIFYVRPGYALIISPSTPYSYHNPDGEYSDDWLHFDFTFKKDFPNEFPPLNTPFFIGEISTYSHFIKQILWENMYNNSKYSTENINMLFKVLTNHLLIAYGSQSETLSKSLHHDKIKNLRLTIQNTITEQHSVKNSANAIGLSESYFQFLYHSFFGISFKQDIIKMRVDYACHLLTATNVPIENIAEMCGYSSEVHFYRQFKKTKGMTPFKYRKRSAETF